MKPVRAYLVLEDGSIYEGEARGAFREMACEVVFNTSMTGYLEILTDPSYAGQGVVMTYHPFAAVRILFARAVRHAFQFPQYRFSGIGAQRI